jgi:hypothetical protein
LINDVSARSGDRRRPRAGAAALAVAAIAAALAGCGGGGGTSATSAGSTSAAAPPGTTSRPGSTTTSTGGVFGGAAAKGHTVPDVLNAVLVSGDPAKACGTAYVTESYLSAAYGGKQGCTQAVSTKSAAHSVQVKGLEGGGSGKATLKVAVQGGVYDGETLTVSLVKEGQDWKLDSLKSNAPVGP